MEPPIASPSSTAHPLDAWTHDHAFGLDRPMPGEGPTRLVLGLTAVMMVVEIASGLAFGSMALLADGLHMGSHSAALGINAVAYAYARRHARDESFSFGTGKVNALGGFTGALLLGVFALLMAWESIARLIAPHEIQFDQAIVVAVLGLAVNAVSVWLLGTGEGHAHAPGHDHAQDPAHGHGHRHDEARADPHEHAHGHPGSAEHEPAPAHGHQDQNLRSAYLHVLADALTSVLAIVALLAGKLFGWLWMDPAMGVLGALLVTRWSVGLLLDAGQVLLDREGPESIRRRIRDAIEGTGVDQVADLHLWAVGPARWAAIVSVVTHTGQPARHYRALLPEIPSVVHTTIEVLECDQAGCRWIDSERVPPAASTFPRRTEPPVP